MLADSAGVQGGPGGVQLRGGDIQLVELYQVERKGLSWYEMDDGAEPPALDKRTAVSNKKSMLLC